MSVKLETLEIFVKEGGWTDFAVVGIDSLQKALAEHEGVFERWLNQGYGADMDYLQKMQSDRFHPSQKLRDVRSVIVLMAWYASGCGANCGSNCGVNCGGSTYDRSAIGFTRSGGTTGITIGKIARYAVGRDYHKILKKKLIQLSDQLKAQVEGVETYASVDSGPTVDRVLAQVGGLGFFGKNSMLIDPRRGSYFFIASLMTNLNLPETPKKTMPNCGSCTKCRVACPTQAIVAPGVIDARRCIAYLTIENKGPIPLELRSAMGNRLFGCDICQEVCPFTLGRASRQQVRIEAFQPNQGAGPHLNLRELLLMRSDEEFTQKFAGTPLMRAKRRGLLRNACVVAGNSGDVSLIPDLEAFLAREEDEMLREHATWALNQLRMTNDQFPIDTNSQ